MEENLALELFCIFSWSYFDNLFHFYIMIPEKKKFIKLLLHTVQWHSAESVTHWFLTFSSLAPKFYRQSIWSSNFNFQTASFVDFMTLTYDSHSHSIPSSDFAATQRHGKTLPCTSTVIGVYHKKKSLHWLTRLFSRSWESFQIVCMWPQTWSCISSRSL